MFDISEMSLIHCQPPTESVFSRSKDFTTIISHNQPGCKLPFIATEEDKEEMEEATASSVPAKEISFSFIRTGWYFHIERRTKNGAEGSPRLKRGF